MQQAQPSLVSLFNYAHIQPTSVLGYLALILYAPIGALLLIMRLFSLVILLAMIAIFPEKLIRYINPLIAPFFGLVVRTSGVLVSEQSPLIVASNHITAFDGIPFLLARPMHTLVDKAFFESSALARRFFNLVHAIPLDRTHTDPAKRAQVRAEIASHLNSTRWPLLFYPEGWDTNGRVGLLLYQKFLFSLGIPVQPAALRVHVPFLPLAPSLLGTSVFKEVLWLFFSPCWIYEIKYLPVQKIGANEDEISFARRVQELTATHLGIAATNHTYKEALALRASRGTFASRKRE